MTIKNGILERWENPSENNYLIKIEFPEFTAKCPVNNLPDFAIIYINYRPHKWVVELKSLKFYLNSFRDEHISHEDTTNKIFNDLLFLLEPFELEVIGDYNIRGGLKTVVIIDLEDYRCDTKKV